MHSCNILILKRSSFIFYWIFISEVMKPNLSSFISKVILLAVSDILCRNRLRFLKLFKSFSIFDFSSLILGRLSYETLRICLSWEAKFWLGKLQCKSMPWELLNDPEYLSCYSFYIWFKLGQSFFLLSSSP